MEYGSIGSRKCSTELGPGPFVPYEDCQENPRGTLSRCPISGIFCVIGCSIARAHSPFAQINFRLSSKQNMVENQYPFPSRNSIKIG